MSERLIARLSRTATRRRALAPERVALRSKAPFSCTTLSKAIEIEHTCLPRFLDETALGFVLVLFGGLAALLVRDEDVG